MRYGRCVIAEATLQTCHNRGNTADVSKQRQHCRRFISEASLQTCHSQTVLKALRALTDLKICHTKALLYVTPKRRTAQTAKVRIFVHTLYRWALFTERTRVFKVDRVLLYPKQHIFTTRVWMYIPFLFQRFTTYIKHHGREISPTSTRLLFIQKADVTKVILAAPEFV